MNICLFSTQEINLPLSVSDLRGRHLIEILHKKEGDTFEAGIIGGLAGTAFINKIADGKIQFTFRGENSGKPLYPLTMIIGFPRPIQLKRLFRDMAGLGVKKIILAKTELTEKSYLSSNMFTDGTAERLLLEGTVQAAGTHVPELQLASNLEQAVNSAKNSGLPFSTLIALDNKRPSQSLHKFLQQEKALSAVAAIGSERGWTEKERDFLEAEGFTLCSMGSRVLRTETAGTAAASIILDSMGMLD